MSKAITGAELVRLSNITKQRVKEAQSTPKVPQHIIDRRELLDSVAALPSTPRGVRINLDSFLDRKKTQHDAAVASFESSRVTTSKTAEADLVQNSAVAFSGLNAGDSGLSRLIASFDEGLDVLESGTASLAVLVDSAKSEIANFDRKTGETVENLRRSQFANLANLAETLIAVSHWERSEIDRFIEKLTVEVNGEISDHEQRSEKTVSESKEQLRVLETTASGRFAAAEEIWREKTRKRLVNTAIQDLVTFDLNYPGSFALKEWVENFAFLGERKRSEICSLWSLNEKIFYSQFIDERVKEVNEIKSYAEDIVSELQVGFAGIEAALKTALTRIKVSEVGIDFVHQMAAVEERVTAAVENVVLATTEREKERNILMVHTAELLNRICVQLGVDKLANTALVEVFKTRFDEAAGEVKADEEEHEQVLVKFKEKVMDCVHVSPDLREAFEEVVKQLETIRNRSEVNVEKLVALRKTELTQYQAGTAEQVKNFGVMVMEAAITDDGWLKKDEITDKVEKYVMAETGKFVDSLTAEISKFEKKTRDSLAKRLAAHAFRKGKCELEWLRPKEAAILRHKKAFDRQVAGVKNFFYDRKAAFVAAYDAAVEAEQRFAGQAKQATEKIATCQTVVDISACERLFRSALEKFQVPVAVAAETMTSLSTSVELIKRNEDFRRVVELNAEYSLSERVFYNAQIDELVNQITAELQKWGIRVHELNAGVALIPETPKKNFDTLFAAKQDEIAARLGLGRKYGAPRQAAQEKVSSLLVPLATAKNNALLLTRGYMKALVATYPAQSAFWWRGVDKKFPACSLSHPLVKSQLLEHELLTATYLFSRTVVALLVSLNLLKDEKKYDIKSFPSLKFFEKPSILADLTQQVAPGVNPSEKAEAKFENIKTDSLKAFEKTKTVPEFMTAFFDRARTSFNKFKAELASEIVDVIAEFREATFPQAVDVAFAQMRATAAEQLRSFCARAEADFDSKITELEAVRAKHDKQMSPFLANPANRSIFDALVASESTRAAEHAQVNAEFETHFTSFMDSFENSFIAKVREYFETFLSLLDLTPLVPHVQGASETLLPRPSLETLIQKTAEAKTLDLTGNVLEQADAKALTKRFASGEQPNLTKISVSKAHSKLLTCRDDAFGAVEKDFVARMNSGRAKLDKAKQLYTYNEKVWNMMLDDLQGNSHN